MKIFKKRLNLPKSMQSPICRQVLLIQVRHLLPAPLTSKHGDLSEYGDQQINLDSRTTAGPSHANTQATMHLLEANAQLRQANFLLRQSNARLTQDNLRLTQSNTQLIQTNAQLVQRMLSMQPIT
jgi:hypothetical protein